MNKVKENLKCHNVRKSIYGRRSIFGTITPDHIGYCQWNSAYDIEPGEVFKIEFSRDYSQNGKFQTIIAQVISVGGLPGTGLVVNFEILRFWDGFSWNNYPKSLAQPEL